MRGMKTVIVTDPVHESNHSTCLPETKSTWYQDMNKQDKEGCEQFNSVLQSVATSVQFMTFENYMLATQIFCAFYN